MNKFLDNNYYDLIMANTIVSGYNTEDSITPLSERCSLLHIPIMSQDPCDLGTHSYNSFPSLYTLESEVSLDNSGISTVQQNPYLRLAGKVVTSSLFQQHRPDFLV